MGRVCMVPDLVAELVMGRVCHGPSLLWAEMSRNRKYTVFAMLIHVYIVNNRAQGPEWPFAI